MTKSFEKAWIAAGTFCFVPVQHLGVIPLLTSGCCSIFWDLLEMKVPFFHCDSCYHGGGEWGTSVELKIKLSKKNYLN